MSLLVRIVKTGRDYIRLLLISFQMACSLDIFAGAIF